MIRVIESLIAFAIAIDMEAARNIIIIVRQIVITTSSLYKYLAVLGLGFRSVLVTRTVEDTGRSISVPGFSPGGQFVLGTSKLL
jgi:hypothetical protein